jgi:hypothetical protein
MLALSCRMKLPSTITRLIVVAYIFVANSCEGRSIRNLKEANVTTTAFEPPRTAVAVASASSPHDPPSKASSVTDKALTRTFPDDDAVVLGPVLPYSLTDVVWGVDNGSFCPSSAGTVTISCGSGLTSLYPGSPTYSVKSCYNVGNTLKCVSQPNAKNAAVSVICDIGYSVTVSIPTKTFSRSCKRANAARGTFQELMLVQHCKIGSTYSPVYSNTCRGSSLLGTDSHGAPFCYRESHVCQTGGTSTTCSATVGAVSITSSRECILYELVLYP